MADFFVSYTSRNENWAEWIAWQLEEAGYTTIIQAWDFRPGADFVLEMQKAAASAERTIAVLSPAYLESSFAQPEWGAAFANDPRGWEQKLVPVKVEECNPGGLLRARINVNLVGCDATTASERLLAGVSRGRAKPSAAPAFPGSSLDSVSSVPSQPIFPGSKRQQPYRPNVRRQHTDLERSRFLKEAFWEIRVRFENGVRQLLRDHTHVQGEVEDHGVAKFTCAIYVDESLAQQCKVWLSSSSEIRYATGRFELDVDNSCNEIMHLADDPYELRLHALGMPMIGVAVEFDIKKLTAAESGEYLWQVFAKPLDR